MFRIELINPKWKTIYSIQANTRLRKGQNSRNKEILSAVALITQRFGCYCWADESKYYYCGSFSKDYSGQKHNLKSRIYKYLNSHDANRTNTNYHIFKNINKLLRNGKCVKLKILHFDELRLSRKKKISYKNFSSKPDYVITVEYLVIAILRSRGQCKWNRTR